MSKENKCAANADNGNQRVADTDIEVCNSCGVPLTVYNQYVGDRDANYHKCIECRKRMAREWNYEHHGGGPMRENPDCPQYFGIVVGETVLCSVYKDVKRMPITNPGYDLICNNGKKIDVKCACFSLIKGGTSPRWYFNIFKNTMADLFLCLAFDDRINYTPMHAWLIPGHVVNCVGGVSISETSLDKWAEYELDVDRIVLACDTMKQKKVI